MSLLSEKTVTVLSSNYLVSEETFVSQQIPQRPNVAEAVYNSHVQGGGLGAYDLVLSKPIPVNSAVGLVFVNELETVTSAGGLYKYSLGLNTVDDIVSNATFSSPEMLYPVLRANASRGTIQITISDEPLTAGIVQFKLLYL